MRICLLSKEYPPDTGWGGIGTYTYEIAHGLAETGHEVEVVSLLGRDATENEAVVGNDGNILVHRVPWQNHLQDLSTIWISIPYSHYVIKTNLSLWARFLSIHEAKPFDVVEAPEHLAEGLLPGLAGIAPLVLKLHTPHSKFIAEKFHSIKPSFDQQLIALFERISMLSTDRLISPSAELADYVSRDIGYSRAAISIVRNPVDSHKFSPDGSRALPSDGRLTVLFAGRLEGRKGIEYLVDAIPDVISSHPAVRFVIVGKDTQTAKGNRSMLSHLKAKLNASGCSPAVDFIPQVPLAQMPSFYRSADVCVIPSLYDNAPYTCIEAMSCGRPILGTAAGGTREYVEEADAGIIVPPYDKDAISRALLTLLADEQRREQFGRNARRYVLREIDRKKVAVTNVRVYEQAQSRFRARQQSGFYLRGGKDALSECLSLVYAYHKMMYDLLYRHSYAFRLKHWLILSCKRPRLVLAKAVVAMAGSWLPPLGLGQTFIGKLQREVIVRDIERENQLKQQVTCRK